MQSNEHILSRHNAYRILPKTPPINTAGTRADPADLLDPRFPVHKTGRGGKYTYHGPGQRIGYVVLDLGRRGRDVRTYVHALENWVIAALSRIGIAAYPVPDRIGIWSRAGGEEAKLENGRASCRERGCSDGSISVVDVS